MLFLGFKFNFYSFLVVLALRKACIFLCKLRLAAKLTTMTNSMSFYNCKSSTYSISLSTSYNFIKSFDMISAKFCDTYYAYKSEALFST